MYHDFTYQSTLASSLRAQWQLDDVLSVDQEFDFSLNFLPESIARTAAAPGLSADEQRTLNQISAHQYLCLFGEVEEFVLPFVLDHARPMLREDDYRVRALLNFAGEEAKHIQLFKRFHSTFVRGFPVSCPILKTKNLGPAVLAQHPLAVALTVLMIEWMTQEHYLGAVRGADDLEPSFMRLLKYHWMEEAQHAKLDTLIVDALAEQCDERQLAGVIKQWLGIVGLFSSGLKHGAAQNIETLELAIGRELPNRAALIAQQHAAARWAFLGSGLAHERFSATLHSISPRIAGNVADMTRRNWPSETAAK